MGFKRPFDEEFQGFSFKHPKQHDCSNKLSSFAENCHSHGLSRETDNTGEGIFCKFQLGDGLENYSLVSHFSDKEFENSAPSSWGSSTTSEEENGSGATFCSYLSPEYFEFSFPRRTFVIEDTYSSLLNSSPRREVPLGRDHQVEVPAWDPEGMKKYSKCCDDIVDDDNGEQLMGACVISMPRLNSSAHDNVKAGNGRPNCSCPDEGSVRCVRQHVKEEREKLRESIGNENFANLGFSDMGEEVAYKWTEEEERVFHEVVYFNPVSLQKNFWEHVPLMFPSRTKKELVSYYFNVFMLQRRAVQNRSNFLEIDSDNDEWQENDGDTFVVGKDEDSVIESFVDQEDEWADHEDESRDESANVDEDYNADNHNGEGNGDCDGVNSDHKTFLRGKSYGSNDRFGPGYDEFQPYDANVWDGTYSVDLMKRVDLPPTCNVIEEMFGPCTWDSKWSNGTH